MSGSDDLNYYLGGIGTLFQEIEDLAANPDWGVVLDVNRIQTKGLDWLAQFVGIAIDHDDTDEGMRQQVRGHDRWGRGTALSIVGPASHWIPSNSAFYMVERSPTPWHITFIFVTQTPEDIFYGDIYDTFVTYHKIRTQYATYGQLYNGERGDWGKVIDALNINKPAAVQYTYLDTVTTLYIAIYILIASYQDLYDSYLTYQALYSEPFPDITLEIPPYQQLVGTRYYRNIFNQYQTYLNVWDTYKLY